MIHAFNAEIRKILRRWMLIGGIGSMIAFSILAVSIRFLNAKQGVGDPIANANGPPTFYLGTLENPKGSVDAIIGFAGGFVNVAALVLFAQSVGSEYGWGTLRVNLSREPRRAIFLGGKLLGLTAFVGAGTLVTTIVEILFAVLYGSIRGVDMSTWWGLDGWLEIIGCIARVWYSSAVWGGLGALLAVGFRSAAPAIGVGIGYVLVVESLIVFAWKDGVKWLPGQLLNAFNLGGSPDVSLLQAGTLLTIYGAAFLVAAFFLFVNRDVSS